MKKIWIIILQGLLCMTVYLPTKAQDIVGNWKRSAMKEVVTDKSTGKTFDLAQQLAPMMKEMEVYVTYKADGTMEQRITMGGAKFDDSKGSWHLSGDKLTMDSELKEKYKAAGKGMTDKKAMHIFIECTYRRQ